MNEIRFQKLIMHFLFLFAFIAELNLIIAASIFESTDPLDDFDASFTGTSSLAPVGEPNASDMALNLDLPDNSFQAGLNTDIFSSADPLGTDLNTLWDDETLLTDAASQSFCTGQTDGLTLETRDGSTSCAPKVETTLPSESLQLFKDPEEELRRLGRPKSQSSGSGRPPFDDAGPMPILQQLLRAIEGTGTKDEAGCANYRLDGPITEVCCDGPATTSNILDPESGLNMIQNCDRSVCFTIPSLADVMLICSSARCNV